MEVTLSEINGHIYEPTVGSKALGASDNMGIEVRGSTEDTTKGTFLDSPAEFIVINSGIWIMLIHLEKHEEWRVKAGVSSFFLLGRWRSWGADMEKVRVAGALEATPVALGDCSLDLHVAHPSIDVLPVHL